MKKYFWEGAWCINLDRRKDRWTLCTKEFDTHHIEVKRFSAIEPVAGIGNLSRGQLGCLKSHEAVIQLAKTEGLKSVLILEDDVVFDREFSSLAANFYQEAPPDWMMLYLGGNHSEFGARALNPISEHVGQMNRSLCAHAYILKSEVYDLVLERISPAQVPLDVYLADLQKEMPAYCFVPNLASQRAGFSDINQCAVDYRFVVPLRK